MTGLRHATTGLRMLLGSTTAAVDDLTAVDDRVRTPLPLSRRIGLVAVSGGAGLTCVVSSVLGLLGARRPGPILAVDAAGGHGGLARHLGLEDRAEASGTDHEARRTARSSAEASQGLPAFGPHGHLLDLGDLPERTAPIRPPATVGQWREQVAPISRFSDLVLTDWGVRPLAEDLGHVATTGHVLVIVARADRRQAVEAARAAAALGDGDTSVRLLLVLVDVGRTASQFMIDPADLPTGGLHRIPYDPAFGATARSARRRLAHPTRRALLNLSAAFVAASASSGGPGHLAATRSGRAGKAPTDHRMTRPEEDWS